MNRVRVLAVIAAALVVAAALASTANGYRKSPWINQVASQLAGRSVTVRCLSKKESAADPVIGFWGASAYVEGYERGGVWFPLDYSVFAYGECENLLALHAGDLSGRKLADVAWSVLVIVHESGHLRGEKWSGSESRTQCWAMRNYKAAARDALGVMSEVMVDMLYAYAYLWHKGMPPEYHGACPDLPVPEGVEP